MEQVFLQVTRFSSVNIIPPCLYIHIICNMDNTPFGGRSSQTIPPYRHEQVFPIQSAMNLTSAFDDYTLYHATARKQVPGSVFNETGPYLETCAGILGLMQVTSGADCGIVGGFGGTYRLRLQGTQVLPFL